MTWPVSSTAFSPAGLNEGWQCCPDGIGNIWVANYVGGSVLKIFANTGALLATNTNSTAPQFICFDVATGNVWASNGTTLAIFSGATGIATSFSPISPAPSGSILGACSDGHGMVWIVTANSTARVYNSVTGAEAAFSPITLPAGASPRGLCYDATTDTIWTANYGANSATKITRTTGAIVGTYAGTTTMQSPAGPCTDGTHIWFCNAAGSTMTALIAATGVEAAYSPVTVGSSPFGACFDGKYVWAANDGGTTLSGILASTGVVRASPTVGSGPLFPCWDPTSDAVWACNNGTTTISKVIVGASLEGYSSTYAGYALVPVGAQAKAPGKLAPGFR
jgi:hypothetical protein